MKRMIVKVDREGMFLELLDQTRWAVYPNQKEVVQHWQPSQQVIVSETVKGRTFNRQIRNIDTEQSVFALHMK